MGGMVKNGLVRTRILVVDDEKSIRDILQRELKRCGYECFVAGDGREALEVLEKKNVDLILTDIIMPGLNGIELTKIVKKRHDADVIIMTGHVEALTYEEVIKKGASDFIQKPVSSKELLVRVDRVLRERAILAEHSLAEEKLKQSLRKLRRVLEETVNALASASEKRDPYTAGHQQRVTKLASAIAEDIGLSENQIEGIRIMGLLHDIGKISIPIDILNKPGKLSQSEFNLIKEHPQAGYDILKGIEFDQPIALSILQHHERMDGSGYPLGLSGDDIIPEARVLAVADVVEAMASHRPYRPALGLDKALEEISRNSGILYYPEVAAACLSVFAKKQFGFE